MKVTFPPQMKIPLMVNLTDDEIAVINSLAERQGLTKTAIVRQALRHYQTLIARLENGETFSFSGDKERSRKFMEDLANEIISVR